MNKEIYITDEMIKKAKDGIVDVYDINVEGVAMLLVGRGKKK